MLDEATRVPASSMNITIRRNLFHTKPAGSAPGSMVVWGGGDNVTMTRYESPAALNAGLGKTWTNGQVAGNPQLEAMLLTAMPTTIAVPADQRLATASGIPTGTQVIGTP